MIPNSWWLTGLVGLVVVAALPIIGNSMRGDGGNRCAWDGLSIEPIYRVRLVEGSADSFQFCCIQCAERWLTQRRNEKLEVFVTDEASGQEMFAENSHFVRSTVSTNEVTGNRVHVFRNLENATKHAEAAHGRLLTGDERPFSNLKQSGLGNQ